MSFLFGVLAGGACLVIGGYGLYKVAFAQGYVEGYEDASNIRLMLDDDEGE